MIVAGRFEVEVEVGAGSSGVVYRARDVVSGERVAVKLFHGREGFAEEIAGQARLAHGGVARLVAHGSTAGRPWLATEWIEGETLGERLDRGRPLDEGEQRRLARRLAAALGAAHLLGLAHGDVKATNVVLEGGRVERARVVDFGMGKGSAREDVAALARLLAECGAPAGLVAEIAAAPHGEGVVALLDGDSAVPFAREVRVVARPRPPRMDMPLVGRDRELALLEEAIDSGASPVVVVGRAGIGKSRLIEELRLRGGAVGAVEEMRERGSQRGIEVRLAPLSRKSMVRLAQALGGDESLVPRCAGNPLALEELVASGGQLTPAIRGAYEGQLDALGRDARRALRALSVGAAADEESLEELVRLGTLYRRAGGDVGFVDPMFEEVVRATIVP